MKRAMIPRFESDREAAEFWDTHDSTAYMRELKPVQVQISRTLRRQIVARAKTRKVRLADAADSVHVTEAVTIRLGPTAVEALERAASRKGVTPETLLERWIMAALKKEHVS